MKLYHGTQKANLVNIKRDGLKPSLGLIGEGAEEINEKMGYIYLTEKKEVAESFGELVLEINKEDLDPKRLGTYKEPICEMLGIDFFWNYKKIIPPNLIKFI